MPSQRKLGPWSLPCREDKDINGEEALDSFGERGKHIIVDIVALHISTSKISEKVEENSVSPII
jgi:hypothetical protein